MSKREESNPPYTFEQASARVHDLLTNRLLTWYKDGCACQYPRYRQIAGIDCTDYSKAFSCYETEMLISLSKPYFQMPAEGENANGTWTCKTCGSTYNYEWQDFSIHVNRQTLKPERLKAVQKGKPAEKPIPLHLGLSGHGFPPQSEMMPSSYEAFEKYMLET